MLLLLCIFGHEACEILAPQPGIEPTLPALEGKVLTLDHQGSPSGSILMASPQKPGTAHVPLLTSSPARTSAYHCASVSWQVFLRCQRLALARSPLFHSRVPLKRWPGHSPAGTHHWLPPPRHYRLNLNPAAGFLGRAPCMSFHLMGHSPCHSVSSSCLRAFPSCHFLLLDKYPILTYLVPLPWELRPNVSLHSGPDQALLADTLHQPHATPRVTIPAAGRSK